MAVLDQAGGECVVEQRRTARPGIVYVPSGIGAANAAFTPASRIWEDFELPTSDPATADRLRRIPRQGEDVGMAKMYVQAVLRGGLGSKSEADRRQMARDLDARINGPTSLKRNLQAYAAAQGVRRQHRP